MDHITPALWEGDVDVGRVVLLTAWQDGAMCACMMDAEVRSQYNTLPKDGRVNILSPLGELVIKDKTLADDVHTNELEVEDGDNVGDAMCHNLCHVSGVQHKSGHISGTMTNSRPNYFVCCLFLR